MENHVQEIADIVAVHAKKVRDIVDASQALGKPLDGQAVLVVRRECSAAILSACERHRKELAEAERKAPAKAAYESAPAEEE
jgi:hypothetical protein